MPATTVPEVPVEARVSVEGGPATFSRARQQYRSGSLVSSSLPDWAIGGVRDLYTVCRIAQYRQAFQRLRG
jgi:hypothetical protein